MAILVGGISVMLIVIILRYKKTLVIPEILWLLIRLSGSLCEATGVESSFGVVTWSGSRWENKAG